MRIDHGPITRDVAAATRDLALALVSQAMAARGADATVRIRVLEGRDQGSTLPLAEEGRAYVLGRAAECDLPLADADVSREHVEVGRRAGSTVVLRDLGAKNGTWLGDARLPAGGEAVWRPTQMVRIGRTVLAVEEPLGDALADIESAPDEALPAKNTPGSAPGSTPSSAPPAPAPASALASLPSGAAGAPLAPPPAGPAPAPPGARRAERGAWSAVDIAVMAAALGVLALSIAGLVWLLRG
jgi:pSer/pThr/pTyr-binding forkhead associated (FHA) protein